MPTIKEIDKFINKVTIDKPVIIVRNSFYYELEQLMKLAKKEVLEDILKEKIVCNDKKCDAPCCISFRKLKKKHIGDKE